MSEAVSKSKPTQGSYHRRETPLTNVPPAAEKPTHDFLLAYTKANHHPVNVMRAVREGINDIPATAATFTVDRVVEDSPYSYDPVREPMIVMAGSWVVNEYYVPSDNLSKKKYVNPSHTYKMRYADGIVRCKCGTLMVREQVSGEPSGDLPHHKIDDHEDDCLLQWKWDARARLLEARKEILEQMLRLGHNASDCYDRLGLRPQGTMSHITDGIGVDISALKNEYAERRRNTVVELLPKFSPAEIGEAYGVSATTIRGIVNRNFDISLSEFHDLRK